MSSDSHEDYVKRHGILSEYRDLLSASDLSKIFDCGMDTIYRELKAGEFGSPIRIGRAFKVPKTYIIKKYFDDYK